MNNKFNLTDKNDWAFFLSGKKHNIVVGLPKQPAGRSAQELEKNNNKHNWIKYQNKLILIESSSNTLVYL